MRWRSWIWFGVSLLCFLGSFYFWNLGEKWAGRGKPGPPTGTTNVARTRFSTTNSANQQPQSFSMRLLSTPAGNLNSFSQIVSTNSKPVPRLAYRLSNTPKKMQELSRSDTAILLENALIDTADRSGLAIPAQLRAQGDPGTYVVQARGPVDDGFRALVKSAGGSIVAYVPNNSYLVRGSEAMAQQLRAALQTQTVLPYEPYFKLRASLLGMAVEGQPLPQNATLNVLLFADAEAAVRQELQTLGAALVAEDRSPFGPVFKVQPPRDSLATIAGLPGVQVIELARSRVPANDTSRYALGVAVDTITTSNYLSLSGSNVIVNVNDTGVDPTHPDLQNRVLLDSPASGVDTSGHGTHVAGTVAGDGTKSPTVTNASGSINPGTNAQYRGKAPAAKLFVDDLSRSDFDLQQRAAQTNSLISLNAWTYNVPDYDIAAASYDAAVRDSLPFVSGPQPVLYVFPAGNQGDLNNYFNTAFEGGIGGFPDSIASPGTAKNVITVGAVEQFRSITNQNVVCQNGTCTTNQPWLASSDSSNQIANFSSRGNVGVGVEGAFGRFKPDVVAPGTFVVSTRSTQWDQGSYYADSNANSQVFVGLVVSSNSTWQGSVFVPDNAVQLIVTVAATQPVIDLPLTVISPSGVSVSGVNQVSIPPSGALSPVADFWTFVVSNPSPQDVKFTARASLVSTNDHGDYMQQLQALNDGLGQYYRYESGTSMAAADVAGVLALMHEFFRERLNMTNSPALMKALLINGGRSLGNAYDFQVASPINYQGWGQINLPTSLPAVLSNLTTTPNPSGMLVFDQSPTNALATGRSQTRFLSLSAAAQGQPLKFTLVWTDPPGDPVASIKLVNDLDLVVTNLDTGDVFFGNDITSGNDFNVAWDTNKVPVVDVVNNVENVFLNTPLGTNYSVTVSGHRVNVNAVPEHTNDVVQDYALVISSGDGSPADALTLNPTIQDVSVTLPNVFFVTNNFPPDPGSDNPVSGGLLQHQHVGASTPLMGTNTVPLVGDANAVITLGMTNQWHFYMLSNDLNFTNVSFVTFLPAELSVPRMGVTNVSDPSNATRPEADVDLYVSTDFTITNLNPTAVEGADKSIGPGGTEFIVKSNAAPGQVYYVGIKSEDQMAAEYAFLGVFSLLPPTTTDTNGNRYMRGMPLPGIIPQGTPSSPQAALVLALDTLPTKVRRVIVTNIMTFSMPGNLLGNFSHNRKFAVLNNHTCATDAGGNCITNTYPYIYEDNGEGNVPFSRSSDGPGNLKEFIGEEGLGVWLLSMINNFPSGTGVVNRLYVKLEPENLSTNGVIVTLLPNTFTYDSIDVPADATNLTVCVSGNAQPIDLYVSRGSVPTQTSYEYHLSITPPGSCLPITLSSLPPLTEGRYYIGVYNSSGFVQTVRILATIYRNPFAIASTLTGTAGPLPITEDGVTYAYVTNLQHLTISTLDVGLLLSDPRVSDLSITLVSPTGTRVLLFEDRGAWATTGLGTLSTATNSLGEPVFGSTVLTPFYTNNFDDVATGPYAPGAVFDGWGVLSNSVVVYPELPAPWLSNNVLVLGYGGVSNTLPTTNSTFYSLSYNVTHAPYLVGTVGWWPFDGNAQDIFGGLNGLLSGDVSFGYTTGMVNQAFFGDNTATRMEVPGCPELDLGKGRGLTVEGWIFPTNYFTNASLLLAGTTVWADSFEFGGPTRAFYSPTNFGDGWSCVFGSVELIQAGFNGSFAADGNYFLNIPGDLRPAFATTLVTNLSLVPGKNYVLSLAFARNPDSISAFSRVVPKASVVMEGATLLTLGPDTTNSWANLGWQRTSVVFTASAALSGLKVLGYGNASAGVLLDDLKISEGVTPNIKAPIVEWQNAASPTPQGVQFWLSGLPFTNQVPGSLWLDLWDTNLQSHLLSTGPNALTNNGWQHVAFTYDRSSGTAVLYTNGQRAALATFPNSMVPLTTGDLYFGYHPTPPPDAFAFGGGLDEFGVYNRALSDCEIASIFNAGSAGKYSTKVVSCPVTNVVQITTSIGTTIVTNVNGLGWVNGPLWETDTVTFNNTLGFAYPNGPSTNFSTILISPLDPNCTVDNFVLSSIQTNYNTGLLHFTEDTNIALVPIKFAPYPYGLGSNFPPTLIFSNDFKNVAVGAYTNGATLPGLTNNPAFGSPDWTVVSGSITVVSNTLVDPTATNWIALGTGGVQCSLPTSPGHRYQLSYSVRGPGAVSWWTGDVEPLSRRAWDVLAGNNGAFFNQATSETNGFVQGLYTTNALFFPGWIDTSNTLSSKIELGDPENLRLTNSFTIEGWINVSVRTNPAPDQIEQVFYRGDSRSCHDPYWLAVERAAPDKLDIEFHVENGVSGECGVNLETAHAPLTAGQWHHVAAVFEVGIPVSGSPGALTNQLRIYVDGQHLTPQNGDVFLEDASSVTSVPTDLTGQAPFADLDPAFSPGDSIGNRSRSNDSQPFSGTPVDFTDGRASQPFFGALDELTIYGRALTDAEIAAIYANGSAGKADLRVPPAQSLSKLAVYVDTVLFDIGYGDNAGWVQRSFDFTADKTNLVLTLQSLLPGTLINGIQLVELPAEANYLPEQTLGTLTGQDAYGVWSLEINDSRAPGAATNILASLLQWQLHFVLLPSSPPPVVELQHGIPYTNTLVAYGAQTFVVKVPQWAAEATNVLLFATDPTGTNALSAGVLWSLTNPAPSLLADAVFWPPVFSGTNVLTENSNTIPYLVSGQSYYLTITNPNPVAATFAYGVWFDILSLKNCEPLSNFVWQAGIPRYLQFSVPTNSDTAQEVALWLSGAQSNLTVVLSQHLPLPDLTHFDYISQQPCTNDQFFVVLTNTTPFPLESNLWYVGIFNNTSTNVPFLAQACYTTNLSPIIIPLTNGVPYAASSTNVFAAPPGPPRWFFFQFNIPTSPDAVLFEMYGLTGDADLVLQRDVPPGMAPYFAGSFRTGLNPEQIVLRPSADLPDLRGDWYLGIYNNESRNVGYQLRAVLSQNGQLISAQPPQITLSPLLAPRGQLVQWNSVMGEYYVVEYKTSLTSPLWTFAGLIQASTPLTTLEVPLLASGTGFYRVRQVDSTTLPHPQLTIALLAGGLVRISWSTNFPGETLQYSISPSGPWANLNLPVTIIGAEYVVFDTAGPVPRFYRLIP